jgi:AcrR family transcriptional regulator
VEAQPTVSRRRERSERTREALVAAALVRFARDGLVEARTADVAAAAGVSHGTVFLHFPSRDELLAATIETFGMKVARRLHELVEEGSGVRGVLAAHLDGLVEFEPFYRRLVTQGTTLPKAAHGAMVAIQSAISFHLAEAAAHEMAAGTVRRMPQHLLFNTWLGLVHHYLANAALFSPRGSVLERHGRELLDHYLMLIGTQEDRDE